MVATREGEEIWLNTHAGPVYVRVSAPRAKRPNATALRRVEGGGRLRITTADRELYSESVVAARRDVFRNGVLKRLDTPTEDKPLDPEYQEDQALTDKEIAALLTKQGSPFQAAVRKLDERNVMRLKELVEAEDSPATQKQRSFVLKHVEENFKPQHTPAHSRELREELDGGGDL